MTCMIQIHIPLKLALTKMWVGLVQKRSKNSYEIVVVSQKCVKLGLMSLQFDSVSVYDGPPPSKWEVETPIFRKMCKNTRAHMSQGMCMHTLACV